MHERGWREGPLHRLPTIAARAALFVGLALGSSHASRADESARLQAGRELYEEYCMVCHGPQAKGDGIFAEYLRVAPADLTEIAKRRNGVFPDVEIREIIDGRRKVRAHGSREMPIWGRHFAGLTPNAQHEAEIRDKIEILVDYLRSIQTAVPGTVGTESHE